MRPPAAVGGAWDRATRGLLPVALLWALVSSCALAPTPAPTGSTGGQQPLPPTGYGTLREDEVTVAFSSGPLQIKVTPLAESVIIVTAPDTYRRLSGLAELHGYDVGLQAGGESPGLFLVSFFSDSPDVAFVPEELQLISRGLRHRPTTIRPVTPTWGQRRLRQRRTELAVYAFAPGVDVEADLTVAYGLVESRAWPGILLQIQAERARARSRAGVGR